MVLSVVRQEQPQALSGVVLAIIARQGREGLGYEDILAMLIRRGHVGLKDGPEVRRYYFEIMK